MFTSKSLHYLEGGGGARILSRQVTWLSFVRLLACGQLISRCEGTRSSICGGTTTIVSVLVFVG
jgi:hypothetical protein